MLLGAIEEESIILNNIVFETQDLETEPCDGLLYPASRAVVSIMVSSSRANFSPEEFVNEVAYLDDSRMENESEPECSSNTTSPSCLFTFKSLECFFERRRKFLRFFVSRIFEFQHGLFVRGKLQFKHIIHTYGGAVFIDQ